MPYQIDYQMRVPYPEGEDGYYYWTNAWIVNAATDGQAVGRLNQIDSRVDDMLLQAAQQVSANLKRTPGLGGVYSTVDLGNEAGGIPNGTEGYSLLNYMRVNLFVGDELVGYKRWRMPFRIGDLEGPQWTLTAQGIVRSAFENLITSETLADRSGAVITSVQVDPLVRYWQLRMGTKRRTRRVIA